MHEPAVHAALSDVGGEPRLREESALEAERHHRHAGCLRHLARGLRNRPGHSVKRPIALREKRHAASASKGLQNREDRLRAVFALTVNDGMEISCQKPRPEALAHNVLAGHKEQLLLRRKPHKHRIELRIVVRQQQVRAFNLAQIVVAVAEFAAQKGLQNESKEGKGPTISAHLPARRPLLLLSLFLSFFCLPFRLLHRVSPSGFSL